MKSQSSKPRHFDEIKSIFDRFFSRSIHGMIAVPTAPMKIENRRTNPMIGLENLESRPALLLSGSDSLRQVGEWIIDAGFWAVHSCLFHQELDDLEPGSRKWSIVLIAIDDFGGITKVIEDLRHLRRILPDLPVILLSAEVHGDDFSNVRKHICDVTVRLPVSLTRLNLAICESVVNNTEWAALSEGGRSNQSSSEI